MEVFLTRVEPRSAKPSTPPPQSAPATLTLPASTLQDSLESRLTGFHSLRKIMRPHSENPSPPSGYVPHDLVVSMAYPIPNVHVGSANNS